MARDLSFGKIRGMYRVVITGGPSGGKTTLLETIQRELGTKVTVVPESATLLYRGGFPRGKTETGMIHAQRAIYFCQKELEDLVLEQAKASPAKGGPAIVMVCDRGTLDAIAYWPRSEADFFSSVNSSRESELKRYDWVIHLDTATQDSYETSNPIRTETFDEAVRLNDKIKEAWRGHQQRIVITHSTEFLEKMKRGVTLIRDILSGKTFEQIGTR